MNLKDYFIVVIIFAGLDTIKHYLKDRIGKIPSRDHDFNIEDFKSKKAYEIQVDSFFRNISSDKVAELFTEWYSLAFSPKKLGRTTMDFTLKLNMMMDDVIAYGSGETIRRLGVFQYYNYSFIENISQKGYKKIYYNKDDEIDKHELLHMCLMVYVIVSLKKDFTGNWIDAMDLIMIKREDYLKHEDSFKKANIEAKKLLNLK